MKMKRHLLQIFGGSLDMKLLCLVGNGFGCLGIPVSLGGSQKTANVLRSQSLPDRKTARTR